MHNSLEIRLRRLEATEAPSLPMVALVVMARDDEDAQAQIAEAIVAGRHRPGWPAIILTGSPPLHEGDHR